MKSVEYKNGFLLISSLGWVYRLENWGKVTAKLVNATGKNQYFINNGVKLTSMTDYAEFLQTKYRPFFLQMDDLIIYDNELLRVVGFERNNNTRRYILISEVLDSKGKYKYTMKYVCDEKFIKGFEYADRV